MRKLSLLLMAALVGLTALVGGAPAQAVETFGSRERCSSTQWGMICAKATGPAHWDGIDVRWYGNGSNITIRLGWDDNRSVHGGPGGAVSGAGTRTHWWRYPWSGGDCVVGYVRINGTTYTAPSICA